ncbi:hypothetical protein Glove_347g11 [Diversispora epigaea]|uniref:Uncharacterized protein n=1 Tax=Diversispora epigaea TaxID=1348612 RepID=A0A397HF10_9GLOM|nr:hypothetical protein Glove_347g11 [Diversispora epigaea]
MKIIEKSNQYLQHLKMHEQFHYQMILKENIKEQLKSRGILRGSDAKKKYLIKELEVELAKETLSKISDNIESPSNILNSDNNKGKNFSKNKNKSIIDPSSQFSLWSLICGWALKSMQKYGKKGGGKHISKKVWNLLQEYFLEGNIDKSERHTAESMFFN